ncbi:MAG: FliH/SctL family protein [Bryobacterales bacterium]|nr:FliH/SctL family protein [Bryobacterales bacterium]
MVRKNPEPRRSDRPDALQGLAKSALERLAGKTVQCVRIHPEDLPVVEKALASQSGKRAIRVEADASLARGSLLFDTDFGTLDGSISTQLEEIETGLTDRLRRSAR